MKDQFQNMCETCQIRTSKIRGRSQSTKFLRRHPLDVTQNIYPFKIFPDNFPLILLGKATTYFSGECSVSTTLVKFLRIIKFWTHPNPYAETSPSDNPWYIVNLLNTIWNDLTEWNLEYFIEGERNANFDPGLSEIAYFLLRSKFRCSNINSLHFKLYSYLECIVLRCFIMTEIVVH